MEMGKRIFVNRSLQMDKIKFIGFDMDATLAVYKSPEAEELAFDLVKEKLVEIGYPKEILNLRYDSSFGVRCVCFDKKYGNLLKTDEHHNILQAWHGFKNLSSSEIRFLYPNKHIIYEDDRMFMLNTVFNLPEIYLLACMVNIFESSSEYQRLQDGTGFLYESQKLTFRTIFSDSRKTFDWVHMEGSLKPIIMSQPSRFIEYHPRAYQTLSNLRADGKILFLLTNSGWMFTNTLMSFILGPNWEELFNIVIVDGNKPRWFTGNESFREVDKETGQLKLGYHQGGFLPGHVYKGGSAAKFRRIVNLAGKDTLYVGDHIFGDVLKSKKTGGWRTLLIVPELEQDLMICASQQKSFRRLKELDDELQEAASSTEKRDKLKQILEEMSELTFQMEQCHGSMGSLLRCGWRPTFYASQIRKYADLYTSSVYNLSFYSSGYYFRASSMLLPHESELDKLATSRLNDCKLEYKNTSFDGTELLCGETDSDACDVVSNSLDSQLIP